MSYSCKCLAVWETGASVQVIPRSPQRFRPLPIRFGTLGHPKLADEEGKKWKKHMLMVKSGGRNLNNNRIVNSTSSWWMFRERERHRIAPEMVNYMTLPTKLKSPTVSEVYAAHLQTKLMFPTRLPRISPAEANINRPGNFNRRHDHGTGTASFLASGLQSRSCRILEVEVNDDLTIFDMSSDATWRNWFSFI